MSVLCVFRYWLLMITFLFDLLRSPVCPADPLLALYCNIFDISVWDKGYGTQDLLILSALLYSATRPKQASLNSLHVVFDFFANISFQKILKNTNNKKKKQYNSKTKKKGTKQKFRVLVNGRFRVFSKHVCAIAMYFVSCARARTVWRAKP